MVIMFVCSYDSLCCPCRANSYVIFLFDILLRKMCLCECLGLFRSRFASSPFFLIWIDLLQWLREPGTCDFTYMVFFGSKSNLSIFLMFHVRCIQCTTSFFFLLPDMDSDVQLSRISIGISGATYQFGKISNWFPNMQMQ